MGSTSQATTPKKTANIDKNDLNSNQEAQPVPYLAGRNRIPLTWISPLYNRKSKAAPSATGGGKGSSSATSSYNYYADFFATICVCGHTPVRALRQVIIDHVVVWSGNLVRGSADFETVTLANYGPMRIYWGTQTQPVLDWFACHFNATTADDQFDAQPSRTDLPPPYRGICYVACKQLFLGSGRTQVPTIEVIVERAPLWIAGQPAPVVDQRGANVIALLYEWLVDDWFGGGLDVAQLNLDAWLAAYAAAEALGHHVSPIITDQTGFRQIVAQLLEYFDGWLRRDGARLTPGFWQHGATDTSALPIIDDNVLTAEPALTSGGYGDTLNQVYVTFRDETRYFHDASQPAVDGANRLITRSQAVEYVKREWIIDQAHAAAYAVEYLNLMSQPGYDGPIKVKREFLTAHGLGPGKLVKLESGSYGLDIVARIKAATAPEDKSGVTELRLESERGIFPTIYQPVPPPRLADFVVVATEVVHARLVALPSGLKDNADAQIGVLAERPDPTLTGFRVHLSRDGATYDLLIPEAAFAVRGTLGSNYGASESDALSVQITGPDAELVVSQSESQRDGRTLLMWVGDEICSVGEVEAMGGGTYTVQVDRGLYGTAAADHASGAEVWFAYRAQLPRAERPGTIDAGADIWIKFQTHNQRADEDLAEALAVQYVVPAGSAVATPGNLVVQTDVEVGTDARLYSHLHVFWQSPADAAITSWEVRYRPASGTEADWITTPASSPETDLQVQPGVDYLVQVRAFSTFGEPSAWTAATEIVSAKASPFIVTGFQLVDGKTTNVYRGRHAKFVWRVGNSPVQATAIGDEPDGVTDGKEDPLIQGYEFGVFDVPGTGEQMYSHLRGKAAVKCTFTEEENVESFGAYRSDYRAGVRALDTSGGSSPWTYLDVTNGPPGRPRALIVAHTAVHTNHLLWVPATDTDIVLTHVRYTTDGSGFDTSLEAGHVAKGIAVFTHAGLAATKHASYWIQHEDVAGNLGQPYPPADQPGINVEMGGLVLGSGATQLNADMDGNLWIGASDFGSSPVRFAKDGSVFINGTGNNTIDIGAISTNVKSPKLVPAATVFTGLLVVTMTSKTLGAEIIYTLDGTDPSGSNGTAVANGTSITISSTTTVKAIARKLGTLSTAGGATGPSAMRVQTYTVDPTICSDPSANPPGGTFSPAGFPLSVTLACATAGATICWSLSSPPASAADGTVYIGTAIQVPGGATLYTRAFKSGLTPSTGLAQLYAPINDGWNGGNPPVGGGGYMPLLN